MLIDSIKKRRSIRSYKDKSVPERDLKMILTAAMFSPSAAHRRPWEFVVTQEKEARELLSKATPWSRHVKEAPAMIIIIADDSQSREWKEDCGIVAENICLQATEEKIGSCIIQVEGHSVPGTDTDSESYIRDLLQIPDHFRVLFMIALGFPSEKLPEHQSNEYEEDKVHWEKY